MRGMALFQAIHDATPKEAQIPLSEVVEQVQARLIRPSAAPDTQAQAEALFNQMQHDYRGFLTARESASGEVKALVGLKWALLKKIPVEEGDGDNVSTIRSHEALRGMWSYIMSRPDDELKTNLSDALKERLIAIGSDVVCNTGVVQQIADTTTGIDHTLVSNTPPKGILENEIKEIAERVVEQLSIDIAGREGGRDGEPRYQRNSIKPSQLTALKKERIEAEVIGQLVNLKRWDEEPVRAYLKVLFDQVEYLNGDHIPDTLLRTSSHEWTPPTSPRRPSWAAKPLSPPT